MTTLTDWLDKALPDADPDADPDDAKEAKEDAADAAPDDDDEDDDEDSEKAEQLSLIKPEKNSEFWSSHAPSVNGDSLVDSASKACLTIVPRDSPSKYNFTSF